MPASQNEQIGLFVLACHDGAQPLAKALPSIFPSRAQ